MELNSVWLGGLVLGFRIWDVDYFQGKGPKRTALDLSYYGFVVSYEFN